VSPERVVLVADRRSLDELCARIAASDRVGLDTEFHTERSYAPQLMVVQIAFEDGVAIVDPLAAGDLAPLADALREPLVVGHALSGDLRILQDRFERLPRAVFDTQIAAAFLGYGMQVSLTDLVHALRGVRLAKSQTVSDWSARPLSSRQLEYLVQDVAHLLPMHDLLQQRLRERGREEWVREECAALVDPRRYRADAESAYLRIQGAQRLNRRQLGILVELVRLRDRIARARDVPPRYVLPDDVLTGLATLRPKRLEDLAQLRRLDAGTRKALGEAILRAVAAGEAIPDDELPEKPRRPEGPARETLAALASVVVGEIARANDLPAALLVPRAALERVAREIPPDREALRTVLGISPWRAALVLDPLWSLFSGTAALRVEGYAQGDPKIRLLP
jgi:ribonuclease D